MKGGAHMRAHVPYLAVFALLLTNCASSRTGNRSDPVIALTQLDQQRIHAQISANAAELDRLYAEDFIGIGPSGTVRTKAQVLADFTTGTLRFQSITTDDVE